MMNYINQYYYGFLFVVIATINTKKGGPRTTLFELCKKVQWPMPTFNSTENKSRSALFAV